MAKLKLAELYVSLKAETQEFAAGMKGAADAAKGAADKITAAFSGVAAKVKPITDKIGSVFSGITTKMQPVISTIKNLSGQVMQGLATAFTVGSVAASALVGAITGVGGALLGLALKAAPLEGIGMAFQNMAGNVGLSLDALRQGAAGTVSDFELMRAANTALTGAGVQLGQAMGQQLPGLLEIARASARATGQDVGFLFNSLVTGIKRGSKLLIDNTGLVLNTGDANLALAESLGKTVEQLTDEEKQVALLNATIAAGQPLIAQVGLDSLTTAERVAQAKTSFQNLADSLGLALGPALGNAATRVYDLVNTLSGPLVGVMESRVAPALDLVIDGLGGMVSAAIQSGSAFINQFGGTMLAAASGALSWGINITTQLATGLIQGAVSAITAAMNFIGGLLSSWLSPGSPPKVAPDIDDWGSQAFTQYLKGFTEANFDVLEGIQGPLDKALNSLVDTGALSATEASSTFKGLTQDIAGALDTFTKTGKVSEDLFSKLRTAGGAFGSELEDLTRKQFALAAATNASAAADERLAAAQKAQETASSDLNRIMDEYNAMLASGASADALAAKRAEFDAAKQALSAAEDEITATEDQKKAAEGQLDPLEEQVKLQEKVLDQLFQMAEKPTEAASAMAKAAGALGKMAKLKLPTGAGGAGAIPPIEMPSMGGLGAGITGGLSETFTKAKDELRSKFADMFKPLTDAWTNQIQPALQGLAETWQWFSQTVSEFYMTYIQPVVDAIIGLIPPDLILNFGRVSGVVLVAAAAFAVISAIVSAVGAVITALGAPILLIIGAITLLYTAWTNNWGQIQTITQGIVTFLSNLWTNVLLPPMQAIWTFIQDSLVPLWEALAELAEAVLGLAVTVLAGIWQNILLPALQSVWSEISQRIMPIFDSLSKFVKETVGPALEWLTTRIVDPLIKGFDRLKEIIQRVTEKIEDLADKIRGIKIPSALRPGSPTPFEIGLKGIGSAMSELSRMELPALNRELAITSSIGASPEDLAGGGGTYTKNTYNYFKQTVNTAADSSTVIHGYEQMRALIGA